MPRLAAWHLTDDDGTDGARCACGRFVPCRHCPARRGILDLLTSTDLLVAAAIIDAEMTERGMAHWAGLVERLTTEAARRAAEKPTDEDTHAD